MPLRPMLLHRMALVSFRLFCKNLGNLQEFYGQMWTNGIPPPPPSRPKIAHTPMGADSSSVSWVERVKFLVAPRTYVGTYCKAMFT